jgi:hypothetical protein
MKSRPHGDFRFSKSNVTANQTVHGMRFLHIMEDVIDGAQLIVGFLIGESGFKTGKIGVWCAEGGPLSHFPVRIDLKELGRNVPQMGSDFAFGFFPTCAAQLVDQRRRRGSGILLNLVNAVDRQIQPVVVFVFELNKFGVNDDGQMSDWEEWVELRRTLMLAVYHLKRNNVDTSKIIIPNPPKKEKS